MYPQASTRFNEAPIHESGKSGRLRKSIRAHRGFNEAPIHESGKWAYFTIENLLYMTLQ